MDITPIDFRIMNAAGHQILLERFHDDEQWQVYISVYVDKESRYDEWVDCDNPDQAREFIATYTESRVQEFLARANDWWEKEQTRLAGAEA